MFLEQQTRQIADAIEKILLGFNHPEMPKSKPRFHLCVEGQDSWSWADIFPNWMVDEDNQSVERNLDSNK